MPESPLDPELTGEYVSSPAERFAPGVLLAGRYRVVAPLGKGGMGEVYRADDLTLAQPVALKFLPQHIASDTDRLSRFRMEVATARKVSHPNVCRVYDISEQGGLSFLTMEYIDGEDLASVLKRLGRVPEEKGVAVARQLCSAVAAVHDQGLLHRDLKPANVMLDGRGNVRLTDFGLAAAAEDLSVSQVRSGTPLYQAPEQLGGQEVTVRSDLYALGLVLYELFTGRRAFADARRDTPPTKPSSHVSNLNPAVERVILRCLEPDPANRPRSANEVLTALPGGDPLAAALAAGETPSPQLVADAGEVGLIRPKIGLLLLGGLVLLLAAVFALSPVAMLLEALPTIASPADQERTAREFLDRVGAAPGYDETSGYRSNFQAIEQVRLRAKGSDRFPHLDSGRTHVLVFFSRRSPIALGDQENGGIAQPDAPATNVPGMSGVNLDGSGRLLEFYHTPNPTLEPLPANRPSTDWEPVLAAARLGPATVNRTPPVWTPPVFADEHVAWDVTDGNGVAFHAEAAGLRGRPVWFRLSHEQEAPALKDNRHSSWFRLLPVMRLIVFVGAGLLAVRNLARGRADLHGAARVLLVFMGAGLMWWVSITSRLPLTIDAGLDATAGILGRLTLYGLLVGLCYVALEPVARRWWPWRMSAWSRLVAGRVRDPLVGRDVLIGLVIGFLSVVISRVNFFLLSRLTGDASLLEPPDITWFAPGTFFSVGWATAYGMEYGLTLFAFFLIILFFVRKTWAAWLLW
ncbi:MAG TPA: serine/threonine-protein kinase, partial [Fimbriiglobus sp.]